MLPAVHDRGRRVAGLIRYLYGPGRREEHVTPHLVAAWDGAGDLADLEPVVTAAGHRDFRHLVDLLEMPVRAGRRPPPLPVWHCSVSAHPNDPILTDEQWQDIARRVVAAVGLAPPGDDKAVRWVAVRHSDQHIHIVATLVRQDRRTFWPRYDWKQAQAACRQIEIDYNLYRVGPVGAGTRTWPKPGEINKATRKGRPAAPSEDLRRRLRAAATVAVDEADYFHRLTAQGITVRMRPSQRDPGTFTGYAVALNTNTTAAGEKIFYSAGKLAADLSLPRLRTRWNPDTSLAEARRAAARHHPAPAHVYASAATAIHDAADQLRVAASRDDWDTVAAISAAAADLLTATATAWEGKTGGPLTKAAELFDRAAHNATKPAPARRGERGYHLRAMARLVSLIGELSGDHATAEALRMILTLAAMADTFATLRAARERLHQAHAATAAATLLRQYTPPDRTVTATRATPPRDTRAQQPLGPDRHHPRRSR